MPSFFIENYGCQMNTAEADSLRALLTARGHTETAAAEDAQVVILNTCSVRKTAEQRIEGRFGYYRNLRQNHGKDIKLVLMGCMAQNAGPEMKEKYSDVVTLVWGTYNKDGIADFLDRLEAPGDHLALTDYRFLDARPQEKYPFRAFLPITHGCNNYCSYCIVPYVRGREISRPYSQILDNARRLAHQGVLEITLLGQNVNSWAEGGADFPDLLNAVADVPGLARVTFLTSHPKDFSNRLYEVVRDNPRVLKNVHLPAQSGSDRVLSAMNRRYTREQYLEKAMLVKSIPNLTLTTDLIVGFPGETDAEFRETLSLVSTVRYQEAFMYQYNRRKGTPAAVMDGQLPRELRVERLAELIALQSQIEQELLRSWLGKETEVLWESYSKKNKNELGGRTREGLQAYGAAQGTAVGSLTRARIESVSGKGVKVKIL